MAYTGRASLTSAAEASRSIDRQGHHSTIIAPISLSQKKLSQKDRASGAVIPLSFGFSATRKHRIAPRLVVGCGGLSRSRRRPAKHRHVFTQS
jgi:hypothetical protein